METAKEIKIYGTLRNHTLDPNKADAQNPQLHHDALAYAKELYDDQFGEPVAVDNYQDEINKRVKGIKYNEGHPGTTTIDGNLIVTGDTNLEGDTKFDGDIVVEGDTHVTNLYVTGETNLSLNDLHDVDVDDVRDHQALVYDMDNGKWIAGNPNGVKKLDDLEDVESDLAHTGDTLIFDDDTNTWTYGKPNMDLNDLSDVNAPDPQENQLLIYKDGEWKPINPEDVPGICLWKVENKTVNGVSQPCLVPTKNYPIYIPSQGIYDGAITS